MFEVFPINNIYKHSLWWGDSSILKWTLVDKSNTVVQSQKVQGDLKQILGFFEVTIVFGRQNYIEFQTKNRTFLV